MHGCLVSSKPQKEGHHLLEGCNVLLQNSYLHICLLQSSILLAEGLLRAAAILCCKKITRKDEAAMCCQQATSNSSGSRGSTATDTCCRRINNTCWDLTSLLRLFEMCRQ